MSFLEIILVILLVSGSAFLSTAEVALFSLSRFQFRQIRENFKNDFRRIKKLLGDPGGILISILVANELINIALSTIIAGSIENNWQEKELFLSNFLPQAIVTSTPTWLLQMLTGLAITTPIVLFFCESTPKVIGVRGNQVVAPLTSAPLNVLYIAFKPFRMILSRLIRLIAGQEESIDQKKLKEEEFLVLVEKARQEGTVLESEEDLIKNVFELDDTTVEDIYTPMGRVYAIHEDLKALSVVNEFRRRNFTRIPVYKNAKKEISGVLYVKDLLKALGNKELLNQPAKTFMREPYIVKPSMQLNRLFRQMRQNQVHMAIVQDDSKQGLGVVTMKDLLDEIFEDLIED